MAIALQGTATVYEGASVTSAVIPYPSGITSTDILVAIVTDSGSTAPTTNPGGWTLAGSQSGPSSAPSTAVWYKQGTGSEPADVTFTTSGTAGRVTGTMSRWSGVDTTTPIDVTAVSANSTVATTFTMPSITTVTDGAMLIHDMNINASNTSTNNIDTLAGTTLYSETTGTGRLQKAFYEERATAGATGTRGWTKSGATALQWAGITIALRPGAGGPPPTPLQGRKAVRLHPGKSSGKGRATMRFRSSRRSTEGAPPTDYTATPADPLALTDGASTAAANTRTPADTQDVTDEATRAAGNARTATDSVAATDEVSALLGQVHTKTDTADATDAVTYTMTTARTLADEAGGTDQVSITGATARAATDTAGATDTADAALWTPPLAVNTGRTSTNRHPGRSPGRGANRFRRSSRSTTQPPVADGVPYPTLMGTPSLYENASSTTAVVPYPAGIVSGELLTGHVSFSGATPPTDVPAGWTAGPNVDAGTSVQTSTYYRVSDGTETGDVTWTSTAAAGRTTGIIIRWSGVDNTTPLDVASVSAISNGATYDVVAPTQTTVTANTLVVTTAAVNASASTDIATADGWTRDSGSTGTGRRMAVFHKLYATAGATGTTTWAQATQVAGLEMVAISLALRSGVTTPTLTQRIVGISGTTTATVQAKTSGAASVRLKIGTDSAVTTGIIWGQPIVPGANGDATLTATGLTPGTQYYYRVAMTASNFESLDTDAQVGKLKTAPSGVASFAFNFGSCTNNTDSTSLSAIATRADDLFFHVGDLYYADASGTTVANFRTKMNAKITAANHKAIFATTPTAYTPSDHDGMNNNTNAGSDATAWANWNTAYAELWPAPATYYAFTWGRVRFIQIDTRSYSSAASATDNSSKTRLGATQKQWFKDEISAAAEPLIIVLNADPWIGSAVTGDDAWLGFTTERTELADHFVAARKARNVIFTAGDMHGLAADDGTNAPGGITVFHGSPLDNTASQKGGPYRTGIYPASGSAVVQQYGRVVITDNTTSITAAFTGYSADNTARITMTKTVATPLDAAGYTDYATRITTQQQTKTDTAGAADTVTIDRSVVKTFADSAGVADTTAAGRGLGATDQAGATDDVTVFFGSAAAEDSAGVTDTATRAAGTARTPGDTAGAADAIILSRARTITDPAGTTDTPAAAQGMARTAASSLTASGTTQAQLNNNFDLQFADTANTTDQTSPGQARTPTDPAAATDATGQEQATARTATDVAGATDAHTASPGQARTPADTAGAADAHTLATDRGQEDTGTITDTADFTATSETSADDPAEASDQTITELVIEAEVAEQAGAADTVTTGIDFPRTIDEALGLTDYGSRPEDFTADPADTAGATDAATAETLFVNRTADDQADATDAHTLERGGNPADTAGLVDGASVTISGSRTLADTGGLQDSAIVVQSATRTTPDTATVTDAATPAAGAARTATDQSAATDTAARALATARTAPDTSGISDVTTHTATATRTATDTATAADTAVHTATTARTGTDQTGISDDVTANTGPVRTPADTATGTDGVTVTKTGARTITDTAGGTDTASRTTTSTRTATDPAGAADTRTTGVGGDRAASDPSGATDTAARVTAQARAATDPAGVTDSTQSTGATARTATDPAAATDTGQTAQGTARTVTDTAGAADTRTIGQGTARTPADQAGATDTATWAATTARTITDTASLSDAYDGSLYQPANRTDPAGVTDMAAATQASTRTTADTAGATDSRTTAAAAARTPADQCALADATARTTTHARTHTDTTPATDTATRAAGTARDSADQSGATDQASTGQALARTPADTATGTDVVEAQHFGVDNATLNNPHGLTDGVALQRGTPATDSAALTDTTARPLDARRDYTETVTAADTGTGRIDRRHIPDDTADLTDTADRTQTLNRAPADTGATTDSVARTQQANHSFDDPATGTDAHSAVQDNTPAVDDTAAASDTITITQTRYATITENIGSADTAPRTASILRTAADPTQLSDALQTHFAEQYNKFPLDTLSLGDNVVAALETGEYVYGYLPTPERWAAAATGTRWGSSQATERTWGTTGTTRRWAAGTQQQRWASEGEQQ